MPEKKGGKSWNGSAITGFSCSLPPCSSACTYSGLAVALTESMANIPDRNPTITKDIQMRIHPMAVRQKKARAVATD